MNDGPNPDDCEPRSLKDRAMPGNWRVEKMNEDGGYDAVRVFTGPDAREQAIRYVEQEFGEHDDLHAVGNPGLAAPQINEDAVGLFLV
jgi:hypothetical protein